MDTLALCMRIQISKAVTPKDGFVCHLEHWWVVTPEREILVYRGRSPQCNTNKRIAEMVRDKLYPGCAIEFIAAVYLPQENP